jgi:hypothetical protein
VTRLEAVATAAATAVVAWPTTVSAADALTATLNSRFDAAADSSEDTGSVAQLQPDSEGLRIRCALVQALAAQAIASGHSGVTAVAHVVAASATAALTCTTAIDTAAASANAAAAAAAVLRAVSTATVAHEVHCSSSSSTSGNGSGGVVSLLSARSKKSSGELLQLLGSTAVTAAEQMADSSIAASNAAAAASLLLVCADVLRLSMFDGAEAMLFQPGQRTGTLLTTMLSHCHYSHGSCYTCQNNAGSCYVNH